MFQSRVESYADQRAPNGVGSPLEWRHSMVLWDGRSGVGQRHPDGLFHEQHPDGGTDYGTFEARVTTAGGAVTLEGTWKFSGGTGAFARITGSGTWKIDAKWEGAYQLG